MLRITKNDLILFKYLMEEKFIHIDIVKKYLGRNYEESSYRRRLADLRKEGYIKYIGDPLSHRNYIFPTKKALIVYKLKYEELKEEVILNGNSLVGYNNPEKYNLKKDINFNTILEDIKLTELRFMMEDLGVDHWRRNTMYYNEYAKNPNATFKIDSNNYAVELETKFKGEKKYRDDFMKFDKVDKIDFKRIIYITTKNSVFHDLSDLIEEIFIPELSGPEWKKKYAVAKYKDFEKEIFITYRPIEKNKKKDATKDLEKYISYKKGNLG